MPGIALVQCKVNDTWTQAYAVHRAEKEAAVTALHGCALPPAPLRVPHALGVALGWSNVVKRLEPSTEGSAQLPGVLERLQRVFELQQAARRKSQIGGFAGRTAHEIERLLAVEQESERARPTATAAPFEASSVCSVSSASTRRTSMRRQRFLTKQTNSGAPQPRRAAACRRFSPSRERQAPALSQSAHQPQHSSSGWWSTRRSGDTWEKLRARTTTA